MLSHERLAETLLLPNRPSQGPPWLFSREPKVPAQQYFAPSPGPTPSGGGLFFMATVYVVVALDTQFESLPAAVQNIESPWFLVHKSQSDSQKVSRAPVAFTRPSVNPTKDAQTRASRRGVGGAITCGYIHTLFF